MKVPLNPCVEVVDELEGGRGGDGVDQHETVAVLHELVDQRCVLLLTGRVHDVQRARHAVHLELFPVVVVVVVVVFALAGNRHNKVQPPRPMVCNRTHEESNVICYKTKQF